MNTVLVTLGHWHLDLKDVREQLYRAPTPRERERWHAIWLLAQGWSAAQVAEALARDAHTIGDWVEDLRQQGPQGLAFDQTGGSPPPSTQRNRPS
jgi:transposase